MGHRAVIYTRVSRDDTGEGRSNERQAEACRKLADMRGWEVVGVEADISISAYSGKDRPAWGRVLAMVERGSVDVVIAWHVDRMTRSMLELESLILLSEGHGVGVATATGDMDLTTDVGRMVARILAAVARAEVERKSARQRLANAQRALEGSAHSGGVRPFGYRNDRVTVLTEEADAIREGASMVLAGMSIRSVARKWDASDLRSARASEDGSAWSPQGVRGVLMNPRYAGVRMYQGKEVGEGAWEAIIDRDTHLRLRALLNSPTRAMGRIKRGRKPSTLLSGIATCIRCHKPVRGSSVRERKTYTCPSQHVHTDRTAADQWISALVVERLSRADALSLFAPSGDDRLDLARDEHREITEKLRGYTVAHNAGHITMDQLIMGSEPLIDRLNSLEEVLQTGPGLALANSLSIGTAAVASQWADESVTPLEVKRLIVGHLFGGIELVSVGKKRGGVPGIDRQVVVRARGHAEGSPTVQG